MDDSINVLRSEDAIQRITIANIDLLFYKVWVIVFVRANIHTNAAISVCKYLSLQNTAEKPRSARYKDGFQTTSVPDNQTRRRTAAA